MRKFMAVLAAGTVVTAGLAMAPASAGSGANFAAELLLHHNLERKRLGKSPLRWSSKLAEEAKLWADHLAEEERLEHASNDERGGAGENLWMGSAGAYDAGEMIGAFIDERKDYQPGVFPNVSRTGNWRDVGHYTQLIWGDTQELGCAVARGRSNDILVCRYWPAGNTYGRPG